MSEGRPHEHPSGQRQRVRRDARLPHAARSLEDRCLGLPAVRDLAWVTAHFGHR